MSSAYSIPVQEFARDVKGFSVCLQDMRKFVEKGVDIDFSDWGDEARQLVTLPEKSLEALCDLYSEFHSSKCSQRIEHARNVGVRLGRKKKVPYEVFAAQVEKWANGECTASEAAQACGLSRSGFYKSVQRVQKESILPEDVRSILDGLVSGKISRSAARKKLGLSPRSFSLLLESYDVQIKFIPDSFEKYCDLWLAGDITRNEAYELTGMYRQRFDVCLRMLGKPIKRNPLVIPSLFELSYRLWSEGRVSKAFACELSGLSDRAYSTLLRHLDKNTAKVGTLHCGIFPEGFATAYRMYTIGVLSLEKAAERCGLTKKDFHTCSDRLRLRVAQP